jgi:hypothetical protein
MQLCTYREPCSSWAQWKESEIVTAEPSEKDKQLIAERKLAPPGAIFVTVGYLCGAHKRVQERAQPDHRFAFVGAVPDGAHYSQS